MLKQSIELSESATKELLRILKIYWREIKKGKENKLYLSGCINVGAALECSLMLMVSCYPDEVIATGAYPKQQGKIKQLSRWNLLELIKVAKAIGWLPYGLEFHSKWDQHKAKIGDYAEVTRYLRNLVHPARYMTDVFGKRITNKYLVIAFDTLDIINDLLYEQLLYSINQALESEE